MMLSASLPTGPGWGSTSLPVLQPMGNEDAADRIVGPIELGSCRFWKSLGKEPRLRVEIRNISGAALEHRYPMSHRMAHRDAEPVVCTRSDRVLPDDVCEDHLTRERFEEMRDGTWVVEQHSPQI